MNPGLARKGSDFFYDAVHIQTVFGMQQVGRAVGNDAVRDGNAKDAGGYLAVLQKRRHAGAKTTRFSAFFGGHQKLFFRRQDGEKFFVQRLDRKSTRLNSS